MIQRTIDIKSAAMAAFEKDSKRLLLCLEEDRLLIALADKLSGEWNAAEDFSMAMEDWDNMPETLKLVKQQSSLLNLAVPDTQLYFRTTNAMAVPTLLQESNKLFLQTQFGFQAPDEMLSDQVSTALHVLMIVPAKQVAAFRHLFPQATWHSTLALLLKQAQNMQVQKSLPQLIVTISHSLVEMVGMRNTELLIARCFHYYTAENLLYHVLNTCQQLGIAPAEIILKVQGRVEENGEIYGLLQQYVTHVELLTANPQNRDPAFANVPAHYFTHLIPGNV